MTAGHFGFAAAVKYKSPKVPLWALMLSTFLLDIVFIILVSAGIESFAPIKPAQPTYGGVIIHAYYSHSLVGALIIATITGYIAKWIWDKRTGIIIGTIVFSHWILDLIVHRPDLPILPGNAGNLPLLGFALWNIPAASAMLELLLVIGGAYLYYKAARKAPKANKGKGGKPFKGNTSFRSNLHNYAYAINFRCFYLVIRIVYVINSIVNIIMRMVRCATGLEYDHKKTKLDTAAHIQDI
ncbi:MAG: hypothetical protein WB779_04255 [Ignavibacteriaceae bacterium]